MDFDSGSNLEDDEAQHEALVQEVDKSEHRLSTFSLYWRPAALALIPLAPALVFVYLFLSWTPWFQHKLHTDNWFDLATLSQISTNWVCLFNGTAAPHAGLNMFELTPLGGSGLLDITLGFGSFDFQVAKAIDIGWDLVVGRGGQILLALIWYRVCSSLMLHIMETQTVSFYTYTAIGFDRGPLFFIWALLRDLWTGRCKSRSWFLGVACVSLYLLVFPTAVSIITGYKPISSPWVYLSKDDVMYPAEKIVPVMVLIEDGSRIGLTDGFPIAVSNNAGVCTSCSTFEANLAAGWWQYFDTPLGSNDATSNFTIDGNNTILLPGSDDVPSIFMMNGNNISLPSPRLTSTYVWQKVWMHDNSTYTRDDMRATCQPGKTYQWGFSFIPLLFLCVFTAETAAIAHLMWVYTYHDSRKHRAGHRLGLYRAAMDFSDALKAEAGEDCTDKTEKQLTALVDSHELGISYKNVDDLPRRRPRKKERASN